MPAHNPVFDDEICPVSDRFLAELYQSSSRAIDPLIATMEPLGRAALAMYCYRRAHLASVGLAIAATCEEDDLVAWLDILVSCCLPDRVKRRSSRFVNHMLLLVRRLRWQAGRC